VFIDKWLAMDNPLEAHSGPSAADLSRDFVAAMAHTAASVNVVTTTGPAGRFGLTVSAMTSISAEPPLLLACINRKSQCADAITANKRFAVNTLAEPQVEVARIFAGRPSSGDAYDFSAHEWIEGEHGALLLKDAATHFTCALDSFHDAGTHRIFIGRVLVAHTNALQPLVYMGRRFGHFSALM
jgi:flavin reductase (DIM6/NTAB) family NADH-FMN oxidoreductase RutF